MGMTAHELWGHMRPAVPFGCWALPQWFTFPNDLTPARIAQLEAEAKPTRRHELVPRMDLGGCSPSGCALTPARLHEVAVTELEAGPLVPPDKADLRR